MLLRMERRIVRIIQSLAACLLIGACSSAAHAIPIVSLVPNDLNAVQGDTIDLDLLFRGGEGELLGAYDLSLDWDPSLLSLLSVAFDTFLDGPADSIAGYAIGSGSLSIFEVSLGALANQTGFDAFRLASLTFAALDSGVALIGFSIDGVQVLSNELGIDYAEFSLNGAQVSTAPPPVSVPEPSSFALMLAAGIAALAIARTRKQPRNARTV